MLAVNPPRTVPRNCERGNSLTVGNEFLYNMTPMSERRTPAGAQDTRSVVREEIRVKKPDMYVIVLLNDDYTPRDFVVWVLMKVFFKNQDESRRIMLEAHTRGKSPVDCYTYDVAATKVKQVESLAEKYEHPLKCILEVQGGDG